MENQEVKDCIMNDDTACKHKYETSIGTPSTLNRYEQCVKCGKIKQTDGLFFFKDGIPAKPRFKGFKGFGAITEVSEFKWYFKAKDTNLFTMPRCESSKFLAFVQKHGARPIQVKKNRNGIVEVEIANCHADSLKKIKHYYDNNIDI
jgi:hypothetical protein